MSRSRNTFRGSHKMFSSAYRHFVVHEDNVRKLGAGKVCDARRLQAANDVDAHGDLRTFDGWDGSELGYDELDGCAYPCPRCGVRVWETYHPDEVDVTVLATGESHLSCKATPAMGRAS